MTTVRPTEEKLLNFKKLKSLYIFALATIAITVLLSQVLLQFNLNNQLLDSRLINVSGKQRMLSQKLTKEVLILQNSPEQYPNTRSLEKTLNEWQTMHFALQKGNQKLGFTGNNSIEIKNLFASISPSFTTISDIVTVIIKNKKTSENSKLIALLLKNEKVFLNIMNQIVAQYEKEALQKVQHQRTTEFVILAFTLLVLLLEFLFIFKPTNSRIELLISKLLSSEKRALKLAYDTEILSEQKENSVKELKSLNFAMENTLLYCRLSPQGKIIHIGEKFAQLIGYNKNISNQFFNEALTSVEKEQYAIERILFEKSKTSWQGEITINTRKGVTVWLDISMVPVTIKKNESEVLIICFDISERKKAQKEVERLNVESSNEKLNQQKIISSKIVENQENEQNRIAREIHDGIGQMLTGLKFSLESINLEDKEKAAQKIEYLKQLSLDIIKGVRTATFNLMPPELSDYGIVASIAKLTQELSKLTGKNIQFYNKTNFDDRLDSLIEINLYRLTQEAINNAIKYADSTHIIVQLSHSSNLLSINVDDNGKGFSPTEVSKRKNSESGMGLLFMKERVQYINGRVFINSIENEGTRITFNIPI